MTDNEIIKDYEEELQKPQYSNIGILWNALDLIKRQQAEIEELQILTGLMRKRTYYNKFVKEVFQKEKGSNLIYPDADEIYKRYFEQKKLIEKLEYIREKQAERIVALKMAEKSNVNRIVEQLEKESYDSMHLDMSRPMTETWQIIDLDKAIEIAKEGGKDVTTRNDTGMD